jgi:flagellar biosynthesis GTPase FlhF
LHAQDGAVVYVNRYQEPAYWSANEVAEDIQRYARKIGEEPHIIQLPVRPGLPKGTLATWGKVVLEPIAGDELRLLAEDKPLKKGIAIDFIGNFSQSARQGLPIYRLAGGAGFVWAASYNQSGRGTLRFSAVDASTYSPQSLPSPTTPPPVAADPLGGAATAVDAQPIFSPSMTKSHSVEATASPHRGDHLDCTAAPNCGAATPALSSLVAVRDPDDVIAQVLNYSAKRLQQANPADGAGEYGRESAASNFRSRDRIWLDTVVTYWVWLILALIAGGPAGYWLIRLQIARVRGSAEEARRAAEATGSEKARRAAEEQAAEDVRRAAEEQAAEDARRAAEEQAAEDAHRAAEEQAAEHARRAAEEQAAENAHRAAEEQAAEHARRAAEEQAAENARSAAEVKAAEDIRRFAKAKGTEGAAGVSKAKAVAKTKPSGGARSAAKAKAAKKAGGAAAEEAPRNAKRSTAAIRLGRNPERLAAPDEPLPPVVV